MPRFRCFMLILFVDSIGLFSFRFFFVRTVSTRILMHISIGCRRCRRRHRHQFFMLINYKMLKHNATNAYTIYKLNDMALKMVETWTLLSRTLDAIYCAVLCRCSQTPSIYRYVYLYVKMYLWMSEHEYVLLSHRVESSRVYRHSTVKRKCN